MLKATGNDVDRLAPLDGVHGLAVLIVFFSHASDRGIPAANWLQIQGIGHVGVYLFFVLSGFLLTRILLAGQPIGAYCVRRFFRIAPLYFLVLAAIFVYQAAGYSSPEYLFLTPGVAPLLRHFAFLQGDGIFWTIPTEFAFYLVLPVFVWVGQKWSLWILALVAVVSFAWFAAIQLGGLPLPPLNPFGWGHPTLFLDVFLCGVLAAFLEERRVPPLFASIVFALTMAVLLVCVSHQFLWFHQPGSALRWVSLGFGVSFAVLIVAWCRGTPRFRGCSTIP